jgi:hypothetical protein
MRVGCNRLSGAIGRLRVSYGHECIQFTKRYRVFGKRERSLLFDLPRGAQERGHRRPKECRSKTDTPHPRLNQLADRKTLILQSDHNVERTRHRCAHGPNGGQVRQARRVEHIRSGCRESLKTFDGVIEIRLAAEKILGTGG